MFPPQKSSNCIPNFLAILSVPFVLFLCTIFAYFGALPLKVEIHTLVMVSFIFFIFIFFIKHNANYAVCSFNNSFYDLSTKLQEYLNKNLLKIGETKKSLSNIDSFLDEYSSGLRNDNFSSIATTVFPMLGILGTFISIAISMPDFSAQNTDVLDHEISILLSGVGTAFYISIYGIFLSLWWIFFEKRGISKFESATAYIKSLYSKYTWDTNELDNYHYSNRQIENDNLVSALKDIFTADKVKELNEEYLNNFKKIVDLSSTSFASIAEDMNYASQNILVTLEKIQFSSNSIDATQNLDSSIKEFTRTTSALDETISSMDNRLNKNVGLTFERLDKEISEVVVRLSDFAYLLNGHNEKILQDLKEYHSEILKQFKK